MIPNGSLQLHAGDKLLIISESKNEIKKFSPCAHVLRYGPAWQLAHGQIRTLFN